MRKLAYLLIMSTLFLGACQTADQDSKPNIEEEQTGGEEDRDQDQQADKKDEEEKPQYDLEETKTINMMVEGMEEEKVLNLYTSEDLGFSTYVPEDMTVELEDDIFNVYTNYQGNKNEDARLFITDKDEGDIIDSLNEKGFKLNETNELAYDFSKKEMQLEREGYIGRMSVFTQSDKDHVLAYYYPSEFADGFGPRSSIIVDEIVWHGN